MKHRKKITLLSAAIMAVLITGCSSDNDSAPTPDPDPDPNAFPKPDIYTGFPVTLDPALRPAGSTHTTSVAYTGQMARHVLREQVKSVMGGSHTSGTAAVDKVNLYMKNDAGAVDGAAPGGSIIAPTDKTAFDLLEELNNELGTGRNLYGKLASVGQLADPIPGAPAIGAEVITLGVPGNKTPQQVIDLWLTNYSTTVDAGTGQTDLVNGFNYRQLILKYMLVTVFYNQAIDKYLDEYIADAGTKDNSLPYGTDKHYTGKEHSWDEGFGYFGAAANYGLLTGDENRAVNQRRDAAAFANANWDNSDGLNKVSLYTEYTSGPANFAALFSSNAASDLATFADGTSGDYITPIMDAWLVGRTLITNAVDANGVARNLTAQERTDLMAQASIIQREWEKVNAEGIHRYAGLSHIQMARIISGAGTASDGSVGTGQAGEVEEATKKYYKFWGELKGFALGIQHSGANALITLNDFNEIDTLLGIGPVLPSGQQVTGIAGDVFTLGTGSTTFSGYADNLKAVQTKLHTMYNLPTRQYLIP